MTSLDLNALSATDTEVPSTARANRVAESPFPGWVRETYESGKGKAITVSAAHVRELRYAIRQAAILEGLGSRIVMRDKDGKSLTWESDSDGGFVARETSDGIKEVPGNTGVTVIFAGKVKRTRRTKEEMAAARAAGDADADTDNGTDEDEDEQDD